MRCGEKIRAKNYTRYTNAAERTHGDFLQAHTTRVRKLMAASRKKHRRQTARRTLINIKYNVNVHVSTCPRFRRSMPPPPSAGLFSLLPEGARNSPGLPPVGAGGPCPGGPVRNSGGPPPAPGGGYSPATATAAAMPAKLAGSRPVRNRLRTALRGDRIRPAISETGCHNYRGGLSHPSPLSLLLSAPSCSFTYLIRGLL